MKTIASCFFFSSHKSNQSKKKSHSPKEKKTHASQTNKPRSRKRQKSPKSRTQIKEARHYKKKNGIAIRHD